MDHQRKPSFADSCEIRELLNISKVNVDSLECLRTSKGVFVNQDNLARLKVSTVFAAIAIEAAVSEFIQAHCLFVTEPYLQTFFAELTKHFTYANWGTKLSLLRKCWSESFPDDLIKDVNTLIDIRNRVVHQKGRFQLAENSNFGITSLTNEPIFDEVEHMLRHHSIAEDFLSRFWLPGDIQLRQGIAESPQ